MFAQICISIHALREEGDLPKSRSRHEKSGFLSTPSARRATSPAFCGLGSALVFLSTPSARRATVVVAVVPTVQRFLSTPSARRATGLMLLSKKSLLHFYPRPPRGGRHRPAQKAPDRPGISIHALREEGDTPRPAKSSSAAQFLSTPSARRATEDHHDVLLQLVISIHALREEGDFLRIHSHTVMIYFYPRPPRGGRRISLG